MNRRQLVKSAIAPDAGLALQGVPRSLFALDPLNGPATNLNFALARYEKLRFGCSFHFGLPTFTGDDYDVGAVPATTYNPTHLDVRQWIACAHDLGARYAVLVAKYMSGFCLWDSEGYDYDVAASSNHTDVVAAFVAACKEFGIMPGFYYCILDPHNEGKFDWDAKILPQYFELIKHHVTELHSRYPGTGYQLFRHHMEADPGAETGTLQIGQTLQP